MDSRLKKIVKIVDSIKKEIEYNNIENINDGGCCYFAYLFSRGLCKLNISYDLVFIVERENNYDTETFFEGVYPGWVNHVLIKVNDKYYDSEGVMSLRTLKKKWCYELSTIYTLSGVHPSEILNLYMNHDWNSMYNTDQNDILTNIVTNTFNNFKYA